jgi:hypothetical protein
LPMEAIQQMKNMRKGLSLPLLFVISIVFLVSGCSDPETERTLKSIKIAEDAVTRLESTLKQGEATLPNLNYLRQYAQVASTLKPEMAQLISTLEAEGSVKGGMFLFLKSRLDTAKESFVRDGEASREVTTTVGNEAISIARAAQVDVFNDSLVDVINVLADMTNGKLPKLNFAETTDKSMPPTQHLVGNPAYGRWNTNSGGSSMWAWYGQYRMFSDVVGWGSRYRYNQNYWYGARSASYYGDVGRHYYGTSRNNSSWSNASRRQPNVNANKASPGRVKSFRSTSRLSTYAPRTRNAPKAMAKTYQAKRTSSYSNTRSSPSRSGGFGGRRGGK